MVLGIAKDFLFLHLLAYPMTELPGVPLLYWSLITDTNKLLQHFSANYLQENSQRCAMLVLLDCVCVLLYCTLCSH